MNKVTELALKEIHPNWLPLFNNTSVNLTDILDQTIQKIINTGDRLCPDHPSKILKCLSVNPDDITAIICGADPYPQPQIATGYAFGVTNPKVQPSLGIMIRELVKEYNDDTIFERFDDTLKHWVDQGVILINSALSCKEWTPNSHFEIWKPFMTELFKIFNDLKVTQESMNSIVFVFLGKSAQSYSNLINDSIHYKIMRNHPAAETHGTLKFKGFYTEVNNYLSETNREIKWV